MDLLKLPVAVVELDPLPGFLQRVGGDGFQPLALEVQGRTVLVPQVQFAIAKTVAPRGRFPSLIVPTTDAVSTSMIDRSPDCSLVT